jgi:hypothetical protein
MHWLPYLGGATHKGPRPLSGVTSRCPHEPDDGANVRESSMGTRPPRDASVASMNDPVR